MKVKSKKLNLTIAEGYQFRMAHGALCSLLRGARALKLSGYSLDAMKVLEEAVQGCEAFQLIATQDQ